MTFDGFFPLGWGHYLGGGLLIGAGVSLLFVATGRIGGISTFFTATLSFVSSHGYFQQARFVDTRQWRLVYALGLMAGAALWLALSGKSAAVTGISTWQLTLGGFIAGFGARLSNGCTSGHGICGMASLQLPSILAVIIFLTTGMATAQLLRAFGGA